jgi:GNAT superfamily N-acetyltransferase
MVTVRRYAPPDLDEVTGLWLLLHREAGVGSPEDLAALRASFLGYIAEQVAAQTLLVWVAEDQGRVISTASILRYPIPPRGGKTHEGSVINVVTEPGWRKRGVGLALMREVVRYVEGSTLRRVWLRTTSSGRRVYAAAGFLADATFMVHEPPARRGGG